MRLKVVTTDNLHSTVDLQYDTTKPIVDATFQFTYLFSSCIINK